VLDQRLDRENSEINDRYNKNILSFRKRSVKRPLL